MKIKMLLVRKIDAHVRIEWINFNFITFARNWIKVFEKLEINFKTINFILIRFFFYFYFFLFIPKFVLAVFVTHEETAFEKSQDGFHGEPIGRSHIRVSHLVIGLQILHTLE